MSRPDQVIDPSSADPSRRVRLTSDAAVVGLALSLAAIAVADVANPQWSWVEIMASHYVHGQAGWLITVVGVSLAAATMALIRLAAARTRGGRVGLWLLGTWAAGMLIAGLVPADPPGQWDRPPTVPGMVHGVAGMTAFGVLPVAVLILTRVWRRDARWRPVAPALAVAAVAVLAAFAVFTLTWIDAINGPRLALGSYETVTGLAERVMVWANAAWLAVASIGLRRMAR
ncbi:DUF998 domain-containing protein [Actinopolymorpha pittospori]